MTTTINVIETVDAFTTIWLPAGGYQPKAAENQHLKQPSQPTAAPAQNTQIPETPIKALEEAVPAKAVSAKVVPAKAAPITAAPVTILSSVVAPTSTPPAVVNPVDQAAPPVESPAVPVPTKSDTPPNNIETPSGGSCGDVGGTCSAPNVTYFEGGLGACGWSNDTNTQDFFALAHGKSSLPIRSSRISICSGTTNDTTQA